jgi:hypothetical protein
MDMDSVSPAPTTSEMLTSLRDLFLTGMPGTWVYVEMPAEWVESIEVIVAFIEDLAWHFKREIVVQMQAERILVVALVDRSNSMEPTVH